MRERDRLFKSYSEETNPTVKLTKYNDYKRIINIVVSKRKEKQKNRIIKTISKEIQKISKKNSGWYKTSGNTEIQNQIVPKFPVCR